MKLTKRQQEVLMMMPTECPIHFLEICKLLKVNPKRLGGITRTLDNLRSKYLVRSSGWTFMITEAGIDEVRRLEEGL